MGSNGATNIVAYSSTLGKQVRKASLRAFNVAAGLPSPISLRACNKTLNRRRVDWLPRARLLNTGRLSASNRENRAESGWRGARRRGSFLEHQRSIRQERRNRAELRSRDRAMNVGSTPIATCRQPGWGANAGLTAIRGGANSLLALRGGCADAGVNQLVLITQPRNHTSRSRRPRSCRCSRAASELGARSGSGVTARARKRQRGPRVRAEQHATLIMDSPARAGGARRRN